MLNKMNAFFIFKRIDMTMTEFETLNLFILCRTMINESFIMTILKSL